MEKVLYIVTTYGVPLRIQGSGGELAEQASVDSELTLLYSELHGKTTRIGGGCTESIFSARWSRHFVTLTFRSTW